MPMTILRYY